MTRTTATPTVVGFFRRNGAADHGIDIVFDSEGFDDPMRGNALTVNLVPGYKSTPMFLPEEAAKLHAFLGRWIEKPKLESPDFDEAADLLTEIDHFLVEEMDNSLFDGSIPDKPESILDDVDGRRDYAIRVITLADLSRRVRELRANLPERAAS